MSRGRVAAPVYIVLYRFYYLTVLLTSLYCTFAETRPKVRLPGALLVAQTRSLAAADRPRSRRRTTTACRSVKRRLEPVEADPPIRYGRPATCAVGPLFTNSQCTLCRSSDQAIVGRCDLLGTLVTGQSRCRFTWSPWQPVVE